MKKNALTTTAGVLLILYSLINFGASFGQFAKGKAVSESASMASSFGNIASNLGNLAGDTAGASKIRAGASRLQKEGTETSTILYAIAIFIFITAVLDIVAAIGLFSCPKWAFQVVVITAICGILIEIQDTAEDGFGIGKLIFFAINALAMIAIFSAREQKLETQ